jgi:isocitrate/isopropylmalate dehydrogenase
VARDDDDAVRGCLANSWQCSIDAHNNPLTDETLEAAKKADAIILGAVGGPVGATRLELQRTAGGLT